MNNLNLPYLLHSLSILIDFFFEKVINVNKIKEMMQSIFDFVILNLVVVLNLVTFLLLTNVMFIAKYDST